MEEQRTTTNPESNLEPPVVKEPEPTVVKANGSNKAIFIVLSFFIISTIGLIAIVMYLLFFNAKKPDNNIDLDITATPTAELELTPSAQPEGNVLYFIEEGKVYKRDLETKQSTLLPLGEVQWGSESSLAGVTYPLISNDETKLAYLPAADKVSVYDLVEMTTSSATLPQPEKGTIEAFISGFNSASDKLLIHVGCPSPMDEYGDDFEFCPEDFLNEQTGLYVFDLTTGNTQKVTTQDDEWQTYDSLIGWVNYNKDKFVVTKSEYQNNSLSQTKVYEIDTNTNTHILLKSFPAGAQWVNIWDFDDQGKMLYQQYDGSKWSLYLGGELVDEELGFTSMQFPYLFNGRNDRISYSSDTNTTVEFKMINLNGNVLGNKFMTFNEGSPISYRVLDQYLLESYFNEKVNIYDITNPASFTLIDTIEGKIRVIVKKG